jgi:hypothetical protein
MKEIEIGNRWIAYGKLNGFGIGFQITRYNIDLNLGFWFIGLEF